MSFSEVFIRRPIMTVLVTVVVSIFGIVMYLELPISDLPVVDSPVITVTVAYPGASPATMASTVASPLENEFTQIQGLRSIISSNTEGQSQIMLTFDVNRSVDLAAPDVQAAITRASANLPTDLPAPPTYTKTNPSDTPIMYLAVTSDTLTPGQLYDYGNKTIGQRMSMIYGVSQVQVWGAKTAIRVQVDPKKLAAFKIGLSEISQAITNGTVTIPGGSLNGKFRTFTIEPEGQLLKAKDFESLIVTYRNNAPIRLKDIGTCIDSMQVDVTNVMYGNTEEKMMRPGAVIVAISRAIGSNTVGLAKNIKDTVATLKKEIPSSVHLEIFYDKSVSIVESIDDVKTTIFIALFLVILVIYLFLGSFTDTLIPAITLPLSLLATFIAMAAMKFSLDNLSLMGIILAIGFVVDDAIVVLENTVRLIEEGMKPFDAAIKSANEIGFTIVSMTLSLGIIFVPLVFMSGVIGAIFREFSITVILTIFCSGIIALTLSPMMCARMLKARGEAVKKTKVQIFMDNLMGKVIKSYGVLLMDTLKKPLTTVIWWTICLVGTALLFAVLPKSFLPEGDSGAIIGQMMMPLGTSTTQIRTFQDKINKVCMEDPNIERIITVTGTQPGADQSTGPVVLVLKEKNKRKSMQQVVKILRAKFHKLPDGLVFLKPIPTLSLSVGGESTAQGSKYSYMMNAADRDSLYSAAIELERQLRATKGFTDIQNSVRLDMPQLSVNLYRDRASTLGITAGEIETALALAYAGGKVTIYKTDIDQYEIIMELEKKYQDSPDDLDQIYLHSSLTDGLVPFGVIADWRQTVGPQNVPHYNQLNSATISFNVDPSMALGTATDIVEKTANRLLPAGSTGSLQGEAEQFQDAIASLGILIMVAIFLKYIVLGILYESYVHPITVLTTLPVATLGGLATLFIFRSELSMYAYIGIFLLLGIVAKNGIMMVDFANQILSEGKKSSLEAIHEACTIRFRPILMTGLAAIMGAMPIALGYGADGSSRIPLGLVIVGGLIFSQVITLFVTPGIFLYMQTLQEKYLDRFELTRAASSRKSKER
jgi:HAE1 family hydrophobic/amphiphilic exporter-1